MASTPAWEYRAHNGEEGSLTAFMARYGSERACEERLLEERFPGGFVCPRCGNRRCSPVSGRAHKWQCTRCSKQVSVTAGAAMERTRLPLAKWFLAMWLIAHDKRGLSGSEPARFVGCNERTGQYVLLRLRGAMARTCAAAALDGGGGDVAVEVDDACVGGRGENVGRGCGKQAVIVAVERSWDGGAGRCVARAVPDCSGPSYRLFAAEHLAPSARPLADGWGGIRAGLATWEGLDQRKFDPEGGDASLPTCHHVISNLKAMVAGTFHGLPPFRAQAFLDEFSWRYSHRCSRDPFSSLLAGCLAGHFPRGMLLGAVFEPQPAAPPLPKGNGEWDWGHDLGLCLM